jgi:threonine aldolase
MINLMNDYNSPAHPSVIKALESAVGMRYEGYGHDEETMAAKQIILDLIADSNASVHFISGGTQANIVAIDAFLRPHEAIIAPFSAHINTREAGAIESIGHKILTIPTIDGKIRPDEVKDLLSIHMNEHMVKPRLVYISQTTEYGTVYTYDEMLALRQVCDESGLLLYIDGARIGYALTADKCDFTLQDITRFADAFCIGGTKNGLLFGEALVIVNSHLQTDFLHIMKQHGALLAKGFLLGIQFRTIFKDDLFFILAGHANKMATKLSDGLKAHGISFEVATESNLLFPIINVKDIEYFMQSVMFNTWNRIDNTHSSIRLITTWETTEAEIEQLIRILAKL